MSQILLSDIPNDILYDIRIPVKQMAGHIYIERGIYSNFIVIKNCGVLPLYMRQKLRDFICLQLKPNIDYQIGTTWSVQSWDFGPWAACFALNEKETLKFAMPNYHSGMENYHTGQDNILKKIVKLVSEFSQEISIKFNIFENKYDIYYTQDRRFNFNRISKKFLGESEY